MVTIKPQPVAVTSELSGRTTAYLTAEVRPQVGGIIQKRVFREGSDVKAGETLYLIAPETYQAAVDSARAALGKARANLVAARSKANRLGQLAQIEAVSKQTSEDAQAAQAQAEADVAATQAALDAARVNLGFTRVTAPISGRIGRSSVTPGALVTASQAQALATIEQIEPLYVDVTQSSGALLRLKSDIESGKIRRENGQLKLRLVLDDGSLYPLPGTLQVAEATVDPTTGSITLRGLFPNPKHTLLPGMYVRALLEAGVTPDALVAPQQAVSRDPKGNATALVVSPDNKVEQRTLVTGQTTPGGWVVTSGLKAGDRLIVAGVQKVSPGDTVKAVETPVTAPAAAGAAGGASAPAASLPQAAASN